MTPETLEAKLRNQLSPIYGLALAMEKNPQIMNIVIGMAKEATANKARIDELLSEIEKQREGEVVLDKDYVQEFKHHFHTVWTDNASGRYIKPNWIAFRQFLYDTLKAEI